MHSFINDLEFRDFKFEDYSQIKDLWKASNLPIKAKGRDKDENIKAELKRGIAHFIQAYHHNTLIGVVLLTHDGRKGWINRLAVHPEYRRKGLARILVQKAEEHFYSIGIDIIACLIEDYNENSLITFQKLGYIEFEDMHYLTKRKYPEI